MTTTPTISLNICTSCPVSCTCGCQNGFESLPVEIIESILSYQDPVSIIAVGKTCRKLASIVSHFWRIYCKLHQLFLEPTPLCVGWRTKSTSIFSYDRAVQLCQDSTQKWQLLAVRCYLKENGCCVVCMAKCGKSNTADGFFFNEDILLCLRCLHTFCVYINAEMIGICEQYGLTSSMLRMHYGPLLLSDFIQILRRENVEERKILKRLRSYIGNGNKACHQLSGHHNAGFADDGGNHAFALPHGIFVSQNARATNRSMEVSTHQVVDRYNRCCCQDAETLSSSDQNFSMLDEDRPRTSSKDSVMYAILSVVNLVQIGFCGFICSKKQQLSFSDFPRFLLLTCVNVALLPFMNIYIIYNRIRSKRRYKANSSTKAVLQSLAVTFILTELLLAIQTRAYYKDIPKTVEDLFKENLPKYLSDTTVRNRIDRIQHQFQCCSYLSQTNSSTIHRNTTSDFLLTPLDQTVPYSCCKNELFGGNLTFAQWRCISLVPVYSSDCSTAIQNAFSIVLNIFFVTTLLSLMTHVAFLLSTFKLCRDIFRYRRR